MRGKTVEKRADGDVGVYAIDIMDGIEKQPLFDLRTRLVVWVLCLVFFGLLYWGLHSATV